MNKKILIFIDWFTPGFKAGGPIKSVSNIVNSLFNEFDFYIITSDRDINETEPYQNIEQTFFKKSLAECISSLPEKEALVLSLYYDEELNLREIGQVLDVSESRVSQIHSQGMHRLKARMQSWKN